MLYVLIEDASGVQKNVANDLKFTLNHPATVGFTWREVEPFDYTTQEILVVDNIATVIPKNIQPPQPDEVFIATVKLEYQHHKHAGLQYLSDLRAKYLLDVQNTEKTDLEVIEIERALLEVRHFISMGDWRTANSVLNEIPPGIYPGFTQGVKDQVLTDINNYIISNYQ